MSEERKRTAKKGFLLILLLSAFIMMTIPVSASSFGLSSNNINSSDTDSHYFSYLNLSINEVMNYRDKMPAVSYNISDQDNRFNYNALFFPDVPKDAELAGYYMQVLPNGISSSYMELIDANATLPPQDIFLARANEWISGEEASVIETMDDCFQNGIYFYSGYHEIARHTTVRKYQGIGKITATTVVSQYLNDGDPERDYFCIGSYVEMTPEDETGNGTGWKNSKFLVNYDFNTGYYSIKTLEVDSPISNPQTSQHYLKPQGDLLGGFLNNFDKIGLLSGLFGHSVSLHFNVEDSTKISWVTECGYFTENAAKSLSLAPVSEVMPLQPAVDDDDWHVLARIGIDAESGWSCTGGLIKEPSPSSEWSSYILMHSVTAAEN